RIFQKNAYISVDFSAKDAALMQLKNVEGETDPYSVVLDLGENKGKKEIVFEKPAIQENNAIKDELQSFANSIINNTQPLVTVEDGYNALRIASIIMEKMKFSGEKFSSNL
ncbi:MAG: gfo/Idh/MocA family oxidoreductase, partial [Flavobacteriales bacterium]